MIEPSELIINDDGSIFHLHIKPGEIAKDIILVGDPARVDIVAQFFDTIKFRAQNREFHSITGTYNNKDVTVLSTGIGIGNIDIVMTELDALFNIDFQNREIKADRTSLNIVRIGTSGSLQEDISVGSYVLTQTAYGFDGLLNYYDGRNDISDLGKEKDFCISTNWHPQWAVPYIVDADKDLLDKLGNDDKIIFGKTVTAAGFYGPQGRVVRLNIAKNDINECLRNYGITNYEMESAPIYGLAKLLGHHAACVCLIIAGRATKEFFHSDNSMKDLIKYILDKLLQ